MDVRTDDHMVDQIQQVVFDGNEATRKKQLLLIERKDIKTFIKSKSQELRSSIDGELRSSDSKPE